MVVVVFIVMVVMGSSMALMPVAVPTVVAVVVTVTLPGWSADPVQGFCFPKSSEVRLFAVVVRVQKRVGLQQVGGKRLRCFASKPCQRRPVHSRHPRRKRVAKRRLEQRRRGERAAACSIDAH